MLKDHVAIVTGASRGIGEAIAAALARANATVVGTATSEKGAEGISRALAALGAKGAGRVLDVRDTAGCGALVDKVQEEFGPVAILVNNAGITRDITNTDLRLVAWISSHSSSFMRASRLSRVMPALLTRIATGPNSS